MSRTFKDSRKQPAWKRGKQQEKPPKRIVRPKTKASVRRRAGE